MGFINRSKKGNATKDDAHLNWMGGPGYFLHNPVKTLRLAASSCFFGEPMYYQTDAGDKRPRRQSRIARATRLSELDMIHLRETLCAVDSREWREFTPKQMMEKAIDDALMYDPEATLQEAVRLRQDEHIRITPQVILVRAAHHPNVRGPQQTPKGTVPPVSLIDRYAPEIIRRADEPAVGLAYQLAEYGRTIPNSLKRAWKRRLEAFDTYTLAKYRMESRTVRTADVVSLCHAGGETVGQLMGPDKRTGGSLRTTDETWEAIISGEGSTTAAWEKALDHMGHMALLRNLRNLLEHKVHPDRFLVKLVAGATNGQQLPFRYYSAYKAVEQLASSRAVRDAIEQCMEISLGNMPYFSGRVISLCDNSGSAWGTTTSSMGTMHIAEIANLTGAITGRCAAEGYVGVFGDRLEIFPVNQRDSVFTTTNLLSAAGKQIGQSTENGVWLFWDQAIRKQEHWDSVFIYSDMQAGHGGLYGTNSSAYQDYIWSKSGNYIDVAKLIRVYREKVNPAVMVYLVQVAGYSNTILPEYYDRTFILGGWGDGLLRFAAAMSGLFNE